eukprot:CAMPEP_0198658448 /NCGR_PEP_ID=MMETSP1467-20131203/25220_1 /TAXON_ID=1462469 /ORGANISM="unid. sp., Strain CCMP2135" /LENGTH=95 /DNA_ID=CAMNT_0044394709 /DNA_START=175 /DNA_END=462 /DNA_ORIENTATION=+
MPVATARYRRSHSLGLIIIGSVFARGAIFFVGVLNSQAVLRKGCRDDVVVASEARVDVPKQPASLCDGFQDEVAVALQTVVSILERIAMFMRDGR